MAKEIVNLYGFSIRENSVYQVVEKMDPNAPDGFREYETTKVLINAVKDTEPGPIWDETIGVWDTGVFPESGFLKRAFPVPETRGPVLKSVEENIVKPIKDIKGEGFFNNLETNDNQWNNYSIDVYRGKLFNTAVPEELYQLYILLLSKRLTPKDIQSHPEFRQSQYVIIDKEESTNKETEKVVRGMRAMELFATHKNTNLPHLINILDYVGLQGVTEKTSNETLMVSFKNFIDNRDTGVQNALNFIEVAEMSTKKDLDKLYLYGKLKKHYQSGGVIKKSDGIYIGEDYVSNSFKNAADELIKNKDLRKKLDLIEVD